MGLAKESLLRELWASHYSQALLSNVDALVMQECVWEIVYEDLDTNALDVTGGAFKADGYTAQANSWLAGLDGTGPLAPWLVALSHPDHQDFVIPEPATLALLALGGVGLLARRRRGK